MGLRRVDAASSWGRALRGSLDPPVKAWKLARGVDGSFTGEYRDLLAEAPGQRVEQLARSWLTEMVEEKRRIGSSTAGSPTSTGAVPSELSRAASLESETLRPAQTWPSADDLAVGEARAEDARLAQRLRSSYGSAAEDAFASHRHAAEAERRAELDETVSAFLLALRRLREQEKRAGVARDGKRFTVGLRECSRACKDRTLRALLVATDVAPAAGGVLDRRLPQLLEECAAARTPVVVALSRTGIGECVQKPVSVSVLGVLDAHGAEEPFAAMLAVAEAP